MPVSGAELARYGGDTFALLAESRGGEQAMVDAGSGTRNLLGKLRAGSTLLFTHTHLDHLVGLPALAGAWPRQMVFPRGDLGEALGRVYSPPTWPVELPPARVVAGPAPLELGELEVDWLTVAHPDGCVAYRIRERATGESLVVATDVEWPRMGEREQEAFVEFAAGAGLLAFDAQYLPEEYEGHRGWGHSTWEHAVEAARRAGARKLWLMHHAPGRTDGELDELAEKAAAAFPGARVAAAGDAEEGLNE